LEQGYFVDLGAYDGLEWSNTVSLERQRGWTGIAIEPADEVFPRLQRNRPDITCVQAFAWSRADEEVSYTFADGLSGVRSALPATLKHRYRKKLDDGATRKLKTTTLQQILDDHNAPRMVDYLSIDANGTDYQVLLGLDLTTRVFRTITVEHNRQLRRRQQIISYLERSGYSYEGDRAFDAFFVHGALKGCGVGR
jgi:FkbM family methyltransferase